MTVYLGDFAAGETIYIPFHTFNSSGASVTITGLAVTDIEIYRDGGTTQRASDAGYTLLDTDGIDFDGITGIHGFSVATSDNTDAGFFAAGYDYWVVVSSITVDSQTVNFIPAIFSIENRSALRPTTAGRTLDVASTGEAGLDFNNVNLPVGSVPVVGIIENGTMQAGSAAGTAVLRSATSFADDLVIGATIVVTGGTGAGQARVIYDWVSTTDTASVSPNWTTTPDNTSTYIVVPTPPAPTNVAAVPAVNVTHWLGTAAATPTTAGVPEVDVTHWLGTAAATPTVAGVPEVDITHMGGTAGTFASGRPEVNVTHASGVALASTATGAIPGFAIIESGTAQSGGATSIVLRSATAFGDDILNGSVILITGGTGVGQHRIITDYVGATDTATVDSAWATNPDNTSTYKIFPGGSAIPAAIKAKTDSLTFTQAGHVDANIQRINDVAVTGDGSAGDKFDVV